MFKEYSLEIKIVLEPKGNPVDWEKIHKRHKLMIKRIQHERLMHLIVTVFVGLAMTISCLATITSGVAYLVLLDVPLIILFSAYIFHYRFLENTTQQWYVIEDKILGKF